MRQTRIVAIVFALSLWQLGVSGGAPTRDLGAPLAKGDLAGLQDKLAAELKKRIPSPAGLAVAGAAAADELAVWKLVGVIGPDGLAQVRAQPDGPAFLTWLGKHPRVVEDYLSSGDPREYNVGGLGVWRQIWAAFPESRDGVLLRLAEASGLTFGVPVTYMADGKPVDPVRRFAFYAKSYRDGALFPYFDKALTWELRYVVSSWAREEDMAWVRGKVGAKEKSQERIGEACWMVPYRDKNAKGVSVQEGAKYYDYKPMTLQLMVEVGGVCGAISRFGTSASQAFGIPAMPVTQPGHCAHIWRDRAGSWHLGQDIFGWAQSGEHPGIRISFGPRPTYVLLVDAARSDPEAFTMSQRLWWASELYKSKPSIQLALLAGAVERAPANLPALREYVAATKLQGGADAYPAVLKQAANSLKDNPYAVTDLMHGNTDSLLTSLAADSRTREFVENTLQALANGDPAKQAGCAAWASSDFMTDVLRTVTKTQIDFGTPQREGKDSSNVWAKLDAFQQTTWLRGLEEVLKSGMNRKDLYEQPLNLYASLLSEHKDARVRGVPALGAIARKALATGISSFGSDASRKLAEVCDKAGDKAAADEWRSKIAK